MRHSVYYSAPKSQLGWIDLLHSPTLPPPASAKDRLVKFQEPEPEQGIDCYARNIVQI